MKNRTIIGFKPSNNTTKEVEVMEHKNVEKIENQFSEEALYILKFVGKYFKDKKNRCNPLCITDDLITSLDKVYIKFHDNLL